MTHPDSRTPSALSLSDLNTTVNHEPRILDTRLGEVLGLSRPWDIRKLIERNRVELERYGGISATVALNAGRGRPGKQYWLTEGQALCLSALSDAPNAPDARQMLIEVYMAYRRGQVPQAPAAKTVPVRAHTRHLRSKSDPAALLSPPVLRDGIGMVMLGGDVVWFDMHDHRIHPGDLAAVIDPNTQAPMLFQHPRPDADWPDPPRRARRVWMPAVTPRPYASREWHETIVLGRVIATRRLT